MAIVINNISFCILRDGQRNALDRCIASIVRQRVSRFELLVFGESNGRAGVKFFNNQDWVRKNEFNRARNLLCENASEDFVLLIVEGIELSDGWYEAIKHGDCLDVVASRITAHNGSRAIDWAYDVKIGSRVYPHPLQYDEWTTKAYVSGDLMLLRKSAWQRVKFDEKLTRGQSDDADFCLRAAEAGFRLGVFPEAEAKYAAGHAEGSLTFDESRNLVFAFKKAFTAGKTAFAKGQYAQALAGLKHADTIIANDSTVLSLIAWCYYFLGHYEQAIDVFGEALARDAMNSYALRGRGWAFFQSGAYERAVGDLDQALSLTHPNRRDEWLEAMRGLAWSRYHVERFDEAIDAFNALLSKSSDHESDLIQDIHRGLGWCYYRKEEFITAADHFSKAISNIAPERRDVMQDAKRGLEWSRLSVDRGAPVQVVTNPVIADVSTRRREKTPLRWRPRRFASALKRALREILTSHRA